MPCTHLQPKDIIKKAENYLEKNKVSKDDWLGKKFRSVEKRPSEELFQCIIMEIEYKEIGWVVTKIDRLKESEHNVKCVEVEFCLVD